MNESMRQSRCYRRLCRLAVALLMLTLLTPSGAVRLVAPALAYAAGPIVVTTTADSEKNDGDCSLREAIAAANKNMPQFECPSGGFDPVIDLNRLRGTIALTATLVISTSMRILGPGPKLLKISGGNAHRVFFIDGGIVSISGLTIINGRARGGNGANGSAGGGGGGGAGLGGGLFINGGSVTLESMHFESNYAFGGDGGAGHTNFTNGHGGDGGGMGRGGVGEDGKNRDANPDLEYWIGSDFGSRVGSGEGNGGDGGTTEPTDNAQRGAHGGFGGGGGGGARDGAGDGAGDSAVLTGRPGQGGFGAGSGGFVYDQKNTWASGGAGGSGRGGAIFARLGVRLILINTTFDHNRAVGGIGGSGEPSNDSSIASLNGQQSIDTRAEIQGIEQGGDGEGRGSALAGEGGATQFFHIVNQPMFDDNHSCTRNDNSGDPCPSPGGTDVDGALVFLPRVGVTASGDPTRTINDQSPTNGSFVITSTTQFSGALTVPFQISGLVPLQISANGTKKSYIIASTPNLTLNPQADGSLKLSGFVTLTAATSVVTLTIKPTDAFSVSDRLVLTLGESQNDAYLLDEASRASLKIRTDPSPAWLVLLYIAADDVTPVDATPVPNSNESTKVKVVSLNEPATELLGRLDDPRLTLPNHDVRLVVLFDGNKVGDSEIFVREPGSTNLTRTTPTLNWSSYPADHELNTGHVETLRKFITWARAEYPGSEHTMLSIIDHGGGWAPDLGDNIGQPGGQPSVQAGGGRGMSLDDKTQFSLSTRETHKALAGQGIDVLFFDACLMGMIESVYEVKDDAKYIVAGQNLLWAEFPYERYLTPEVLNAGTSPEDLAKAIVRGYNPIVKEQVMPPDPYTIAAISTGPVTKMHPLDLLNHFIGNTGQVTKTPPLDALKQSVDKLSERLLQRLQSSTERSSTLDGIVAVYRATQKFDYNANLSIDQETDGYVDLYDFADRLKQKFPTDTALVHYAQEVMDQIGNFSHCPHADGYCEPNGVVIALKRVNGSTATGVNGSTDPKTWDLHGAHGLSIYLPIGEEDCRWTGDERNTQAQARPCRGSDGPRAPDNRHPRLAEQQLTYYTESGQLAFVAPTVTSTLMSTDTSTANWGRLLVRLDKLLMPPPNISYNAPYPLQPNPLRKLPPPYICISWLTCTSGVVWWPVYVIIVVLLVIIVFLLVRWLRCRSQSAAGRG